MGNSQDRSAASRFIEEHDQITRDLMLSRDEAAQYKAQVIELSNRVDTYKRDVEYWRDRANTYLAWSLELSTQITTIADSVVGGIQRAKARAFEIAREARANGKEEDGSTAEERQSLQNFLSAPTEPPPNRLSE